ncbi:MULTISPECIES: hypothetical protein [Nocardia]|uniref:hypothetical protein n=1 Tax=Nocardia TaxID=1817 RepID=UPI00135BF8A6|nr:MULTISPECIES: hypothetical protein [Nocardia]
MTRYPFVRKFLRLLVETIEFGATTDVAPVLAALKDLPELLDKGPTKRVPACYLDARAVDLDVVTPGWRNLVLRRERPEVTVERSAYVFCRAGYGRPTAAARVLHAESKSGQQIPRTG